MHSTSIPLFLIVASLVSTSLGLHNLALTARRSLEIILPRQSSFDSCDTACADVQSLLTNCSTVVTVTCLCNAAVATSLQTCVNCAISLGPSASIISSAQSLVDTFDTACSGVNGLSPITLATSTALNTPTPVGSIAQSTSTTIVVPQVTITQIVVGPSSTTGTAPNVGNTGIGGLPQINNALPSKMVSRWAGALVGLAVGVGNLLN